MATRVLIVEDDSNIAQLLQLYLEKEGFESESAPDGGKGVELCRSFGPDLVLLEEEWTSLQAQQIHLKQPHMARIAALKDQYMDHMDLDMEEALQMKKPFPMECYQILEALTLSGSKRD